MRHRKKFNHLGRKKGHRSSMLANMACSLIEHKRINTTLAKAKALKKFVEPLITKSKSDTTHNRRIVFSRMKQKNAVAELFRDVAVKVADRPGGYTRIIRLGNRLGDNAEMAMIELVDYNDTYVTKKKKTTRRSRRGKKSESVSEEVVNEEVVNDALEAPAEEAPAEEAPAEEAPAEEAPAEEAPAEEAPAEEAPAEEAPAEEAPAEEAPAEEAPAEEAPAEEAPAEEAPAEELLLKAPAEEAPAEEAPAEEAPAEEAPAEEAPAEEAPAEEAPAEEAPAEEAPAEEAPAEEAPAEEAPAEEAPAELLLRKLLLKKLLLRIQKKKKTNNLINCNMRLIFILIFLVSNFIISQTNTQTDFRSALTGETTNFGTSFFYNQPSKVILGSAYLFDEWNNDGEIQTLTGERFLVRNINLNISRNAFEAKINDNDSIFSFTFNNIKQIIINGKSYKNYFFNEDNRVYELIYSGSDFTILKGFSVKLVTGSGNPMVNRSNDKYVKKESYFIRSGENNMIESFKLSKRSLNKLFENSSMDVNRILAYIDSSNLSYKDESDVIKMLEFAFSK